ncbi:MAG: nuclear transport factor 2 family protein [Pseudomonadota bacterium]
MANQHDVPLTGYQPQLQSWFDYMMGGHDRSLLAEMLHDDVVFRSPVVHTPQEGKAITFAYLSAAGNTLGNGTFKYTRVFDCGERAVLEFETEMDGILVNGVDMIEWDENGQIVDFKVMVRPLKAMQKVHADMGKMLEKMKASA